MARWRRKEEEMKKSRRECAVQIMTRVTLDGRDIRPGSVLELGELTGRPARLSEKSRVVAVGETVVSGNKFAVRLNSVSPGWGRLKSVRKR